MRKFFKLKTVRGLRRFGKSAVCILLSISLVFSFPIALNAEETVPQTSQEASTGSSKNVEYLKMPGEFSYDYGILPAHLADDPNYYDSHDQAARFYCDVDEGNCVVWYEGVWTTSLVGKTFSGRGKTIQSSYSNFLITDIGQYTAEVKPGVKTGYNHFKTYMESNDYQFDSRLIYQKVVDTHSTLGTVASYAGAYDENFKSETVITDWGVTTFEGNTFYTVKDIMVLTVDTMAPSDKITVTGEVTADGTPIIWLDCGETVRPSAPDAITYDMLATLKFKAYLVPKLDQSSSFTEVIFEATQFSSNYKKIGFTATDASALVGDEWRIAELEDVSEYGNYPLYTTKGDTGTTVKSPVTDMAGNPFALDRTESLTKREIYLDAKATTVTSAEVNSNAIKVGEELSQADMCLSHGDWVELSLILSEQVFLLEDARMNQIKLKWDLTDEYGANIVTSLKEIKNVKLSRNTGNVTMLVFDKITIEKGMKGDIKPIELIGAECFEDASHNIMNGSLIGVSVDKQMTIDNDGPIFEIDSNVIRHIDKADEKYLVIKLNIDDFGAGIVMDDIQKLSVSTQANVEGLTWQYAVTQNSTAISFATDGYAVNKVKQYSDFTIPVSGEYFLHLYLTVTESTELLDSVGIQLDFTVTDTKGNVSTASLSLTDLGIDCKAPTLTVTPHAVVVERADDTTNKTTFRADVSASDLNGIDRIEYQWTDAGVEPADNAWTILQSGERVELTPAESVNIVTKILHVRAYDSIGNLSSYTSDENVFTANLQRINSRYEIVYDDNKPGGISDVNILAPVSSNAVYGGYTRVILEINGKTYVRVFNITDENTKVSLLDPLTDDWYLVTIRNGVYTGVTSETPDWNYYGTVSIALSASSLDLTPKIDGSVNGEGDTGFQQGNTFSVIYTCLRNDVHRVILNGVTDSAGMEVALTESDGYKFYKIYRSILGVKYNVTLTNELMESLGVTDIDFTNSYAQFVVLDAEGNRTGELVGEAIPLVVSSVQSIAFPQSDYDAVSGAYGIVIYISQKSGGKQEFFLEEKLLFDNDPIPEAYGVTEYERTVENTYSTVIDLGQRAEDGSYLTSVNVGVAQPSEHYNGIDPSGGTVIYKDGKPAFVQTVTNALGNTNAWFPRRTSINISIPTSGDVYLGHTVGRVVGVRMWNAASSGDPYALAWDSSKLWNYSADTYYTLNVDLGWYASNDNKMVISAEELAATDVSNFKLALGRNVICYQFIMENGKISPESRFEINLFDEAPTVEMSMEFGPFVTMTDTLRDDYTYPIEGTEYERIVAQSVYFNIDYAYSPNGKLTVYQVYEDPKTGEWTVDIVDGSQPIPMASNSTNGYLGVEGTNPNYTAYTEPVNEVIVLVDEVGNATAFYPIVSSRYSGDWYEGGQYVSRTYYFEKSSEVGRFEVEVIDPDEYEWYEHDGITQILGFNGYLFEKTLDEFSIQINDRDEVKLDAQGNNYNIFTNANDAGVVSYDALDGWLKYVLPYDSTKAEGAMVTHTVTVRGYVGGELATDVDGNIAEHTFTVTAPNTKPAMTLDENPMIGAVDVTANTYLYAKGITERDVYDQYNTEYDPETGDKVYSIVLYTDNYSAEFDLPIFKNGAYTYGFFDKYGDYYEIPLDIAGLPNDPAVLISETESTRGPVTVTVTSTSGGVFTVDAGTLPADSTVTGNRTSSLKIVLSENASFKITCTYSGASYDIPISVTNIYNKPIVPTVVWSYNPYKVNKADNSYEGEITATLVDENGSYLTDANGVVPTFTFVPGGQTSYVFTNYKNHVGMTGADVTATLPVTLKVVQTEESVNDTYAPDVGVTGYAKYQNNTAELNGGYVLTDTSRPSEAQVMRSNYVSKYGAENLYSDINDLLYQVGWAQTLLLNLDIIDENATKMFITSDIYASAPNYNTGTSDGIEGVSIVGRTLQIEQDTEFALHVVDSRNNSATIVFSINVLGDEPASPTLVQALTKNGTEVRIYLVAPSLAGVTNMRITNTDIIPLVETDALSAFFGEQYIPMTENRSVAVHYSYEYSGQVFTGTIHTTVSSIDMTTPQVTGTVWSANYDGTGEKYTNQDISLQMTFSKSLGEAYVCDRNGNRITAPKGVTVVFIQDRVTVIYEGNAPETYIKVVSLLNPSLTNVISLPEITTVDKLEPTLTATVDVSDHQMQATVTVTASETVTWQNGLKDTQFTQKISQNGTYTYRVTDRAGNVGKISVVVEGIVTERLTITLSSDANGSNIIDPETYDVDIGDTVYVKVNRDAYLTVSGNADGISVSADRWTAVTISEDAEGLYPSVLAVDAYGNSAIVQMLRIPMRDRTAPSIMINKSIVSAALHATEEEIAKTLRQNVIATDETTSSNALIFSFDIPKVTAAGKYAVTYYVEDEAGNKSSATGLIRFYGGDELEVKVNGESVEKDQYVILDSGEVTLTLSHNGEPYKLDMREGNKSLGQMKNNVISLTDGYVDLTENEITLELAPGYHTFLVTTQGRDMCRFVIYVMG